MRRRVTASGAATWIALSVVIVWVLCRSANAQQPSPAPPQAAPKVRAWLRGLVPDMRILDVQHGQVACGLLFGHALFEPTPVKRIARQHDDRHGHDHDHQHDHGHDYVSWSYTDRHPLDGAIFRTVIAGLHVDVLRGKGFL